MRRAMTWTTALMVVIAGFAVMSENQASAGLFNRNRCKPAKCKKVRRNKCYQQVACCTTACETAVAEAPAEPCGCQTVSTCGCETKCQTCGTRRQTRQARRKGCCIQQCGCSSCGCGETSSPAGTEMAPDLPEDATT